MTCHGRADHFHSGRAVGAKETRSREKMANINPDAQAWTPNAQSASTPAVGRIQASNCKLPVLESWAAASSEDGGSEV